MLVRIYAALSVYDRACIGAPPISTVIILWYMSCGCVRGVIDLDLVCRDVKIMHV